MKEKDLLDSYLAFRAELASLTQMGGKCHMRSTKEIKLSAAAINYLCVWLFNYECNVIHFCSLYYSVLILSSNKEHNFNFVLFLSVSLSGSW